MYLEVPKELKHRGFQGGYLGSSQFCKKWEEDEEEEEKSKEEEEEEEEVLQMSETDGQEVEERQTLEHSPCF